MAVKAEFVISARDQTREAIDGAKARLESLDRTARMLRYAFTGYVFAEFGRGVIDTEIKLQSMQYTLEAATGTMSGARQEMQFLFQTADRLGMSINDLGQFFARMEAIAVSSGYSLKSFHKDFVAVSSGMRVLHLDARHTQYAWLALQEIMSQGTVKMRHLTRQLSIDFPTALQAMALGMHKSVGQLIQMVHEKALQGTVAIHALAKGMIELVGPQIQASTRGLQADLQRVGSAFTQAVYAASETGAFDTFGQAMNELAATIKSPAFIAGLSSLLTMLAKLSNWTATSAEAVAGGLNRIALALHGLSVEDTVGLKSASTLGGMLDSYNEKIAALRHRIRQIEHPGFNVAQAVANQFDYAGQLKQLRADQAQLRNLLVMRGNLAREIGKHGSAFALHLQEGPHTHGRHILDKSLTTYQKQLEAIAALQGGIAKKLEGSKSALQQALVYLHEIKPGTVAYEDAAKQVSILREQSGQLAKMEAARSRHKALLKDVNAEQHKQAQYVSTLAKDAEKWKNVLDPMRKVRDEAKRLTEEYQRGMLSWTQFMAAMRKNADESHKVFGSMNQYAIQAARSMQSAFARFLYDPFKGGLRGMLHSFADALRQMVAQWLAAQALMKAGSMLSGKGGFLGSLGSMLTSIGSGHAYGGPVYAGNIYPVGENGPELFAPTQNGTIIPNHAMGGAVHTNINIDARGAGPDEVSKLLAMRQGLIKEIEARVRHKDRYGYFPA